MVAHMKTTIDIADPLFAAAKKAAAERGTTLRDLVELGLRKVLEDEPRKKPFKMRDASFRGDGLTPEMQGASWDKWLDVIYGEDPRFDRR